MPVYGIEPYDVSRNHLRACRFKSGGLPAAVSFLENLPEASLISQRSVLAKGKKQIAEAQEDVQNGSSGPRLSWRQAFLML